MVQRPDNQPLPPEFVLSRPRGRARAPKDFAWLQTNIPCQAACPAGTDVPAYLEAVARGDHARAYRINLKDNVFPAVLGRVCTRPCEPACRHGWEGLGEPVAICNAKRAAADGVNQAEPVVLEPVFPPSGRRVAVVGGGAAGLTVARELARWGHAVTVFEQAAEAGGLMMQGIPAFRLPRKVVRREVEQIRLMGVELRCHQPVRTAQELDELERAYDAVVLASGTQRLYRPDCPGIDLDGVQHGLTFLRTVAVEETAPVGARVVVIGGGFTAVDCARTARRLGAASVQVYYRRTEAEMYIERHEIATLQQEGIGFHTQYAPVEFQGAGGRVERVGLAPTVPGEPDASGRPRAVPDLGRVQLVEADTVLLGTGQLRDVAWLGEERLAAMQSDGNWKTGADPESARRGLFLAGDLALGALSLIDAIGHAKRCARRVDFFLTGEDRLADTVVIADAAQTGRTRAMDAIPRQPMPVCPVAGRDLTAEVEQGLGEDAAATEASRCYLCHYKFEIDNELCIYCDRCLKVKPVDGCIVKVSGLDHDAQGRLTGFRRSTSASDYNMLFIDQDQCIRCNACVEVCPVDCISLQKVSLETV